MRALLPPLLLLMAGGCNTEARTACFAPDTELPSRQDVMSDYRLGQSARALANALLEGDLAGAGKLLAGDAALAKSPIGRHHDMLTLAVSTCSADAVGLLLRHGAPADGRDAQGLPLRLALRADDPAMAARLLEGGASAAPSGSPMGPMRTAISLNSPGGVRLLLDHGADPNLTESTGNRPLHTALDMERFRIAELLLERGADPWAIDVGGANLGTATVTPMLTKSPEDAEAQQRLAARLPALGWPSPPPTPRAIRTAALSGDWPPAPARAKGARPPSKAVLALIEQNQRR